MTIEDFYGLMDLVDKFGEAEEDYGMDGSRADRERAQEMYKAIERYARCFVQEEE